MRVEARVERRVTVFTKVPRTLSLPLPLPVPLPLTQL